MKMGRPRKGLLHDYEPSCGPSFEALVRGGGPRAGRRHLGGSGVRGAEDPRHLHQGRHLRRLAQGGRGLTRPRLKIFIGHNLFEELSEK